MKRIYLLVLLMPLAICGNDENKPQEEKIHRLLSAHPVNWFGRLSLPNSNLTNVDLNTLLKSPLVHHLDVSSNNISNGYHKDLPESKQLLSLDLSNNNITGMCALGAILLQFPNLEVLKYNNNKVTAYKAEELSIKNCCSGMPKINGCNPHQHLKTLELRDTDITEFSLRLAYNSFSSLETVDLSGSTHFTAFTDTDWIERQDNKDSKPRVLRVLLKNTVIPEADLKRYQAAGMVETKAVQRIKDWGYFGLLAAGTAGMFLIGHYNPVLFTSYPIPVQSAAPAVAEVANVCLHGIFDMVIVPLTPTAITRVVRRWKPNFGKQVAIEFVTNNDNGDAV